MTKSPPLVNAPAAPGGAVVSRLSELEASAHDCRLTIGGIAHDLRNLLCVISAQAELVLEAVSGSDSVREDLRRIVRASERATLLASQLLSQAYEGALEPAALALDASIEAACDLSRGLLGSEFELLTFLGTSASVWIDPSSLERILINLVLNARDAMPAGGPIVIEANAVQLPAGPESERLQLAPGAYVLLQVRDRGSGLTQDIREQLFRPFFTTKEPGKGSGLGLSVVAALVQKHGGAVDVQSEPALGTTFLVYLRRAGLDTAEPVDRANERWVLETLRGQHGHIIIGWLGDGLLFAAFHGLLSSSLGKAYADRLERLVSGRTGVRYFLDSSGLHSFELRGRTAALHALTAAAANLASVLVLRWAGGDSPMARMTFQGLGELLEVTDHRAEFESELLALSPGALRAIARAPGALLLPTG